MSDKNIYQRIAQVMQAKNYIQKNTRVSTGGSGSYPAVSHDHVVAVLRDEIVSAGIVIIPCQQGKGVSVDGETKSGTAKIRFEAVYDVAFINTDRPEDRHIVTIEAHAEDHGDKAPGKSLSYATKMAILKTFMMETGVDDEQRVEEGPARSTTAPPAGRTTPAASLAREKINQRISDLLKSVFGDDKTAALDAIEEMTTFTPKGKTDPVKGKRDYRLISDPQANIVIKELEKHVANKEDKDEEVCADCGQKLAGGVCTTKSCTSAVPSDDLPF